MTLHPTQSSVLSQVGYDGATHTLTVLFRSGKRYEYSGVERAVFDGLLGAASAGSSFNAHVADCSPYREVGADGVR